LDPPRISRMASQNIVIVGGGAAGVAISRDLALKLSKTPSQYNLILVTTREAYAHLPAMLRMVVSREDKLEESALIPYDSLFPNGSGTVKIGTVTRISSATTGGEVILESGEQVPYRCACYLS
jgi:apoptosis-inducing factor 2